MRYKLFGKGEWDSFYDEVAKLLAACDDEFVPPLSGRSSTTDTKLGPGEGKGDSISLYMEGLKKQSLLIAEEEGTLCGFVSFRENYETDVLGEPYLPNIYISTVLVSPDARGKKLTQSMYTFLFDTVSDKNILTRTWSTNIAHIKILSRFGFSEVHVISDDRGAGIDTVYFLKRKEGKK